MPESESSARASRILRNKRVEQQRRALLPFARPDTDSVEPPIMGVPPVIDAAPVSTPTPTPIPTPTPTPAPIPTPVPLEESVGSRELDSFELNLVAENNKKREVILKANESLPSSPVMTTVGTVAEAALWPVVGKGVTNVLDKIGLNEANYDTQTGLAKHEFIDEQASDLVKRLVNPGVDGYNTPEEVMASITNDAMRYGPNAHIAKRKEARMLLSNLMERSFGKKTSPEEAFSTYKAAYTSAVSDEKNRSELAAEFMSAETGPGLNIHLVADGEVAASFSRPEGDANADMIRETAISNSKSALAVAAFTPGENYNKDLELALSSEARSVIEPKHISIIQKQFPRELQDAVISSRDAWIPFNVRSDGTIAVSASEIRNVHLIAKTTELLRNVAGMDGSPSVKKALSLLGREEYDKQITKPANDYANKELRRLTQFNTATSFYLEDPQDMARQVAEGTDAGFLETFLNLPGGWLSPSKYAKAALSYSPIKDHRGTPGIPIPKALGNLQLNLSNTLRNLAQGSPLKAIESATGLGEMIEGGYIPMTWLNEEFIDRNRAPYMAALYGPLTGFEKSNLTYYGRRVGSGNQTHLDWATGAIAPVFNTQLSYILSEEPMTFGSKEHFLKNSNYNYMAEYPLVGKAIGNMLGFDILQDYNLIEPEKRADLEAQVGIPATVGLVLFDPDVLSMGLGAGRIVKGIASASKLGKSARAFRVNKLDQHLSKIVPTFRANLARNIDDLTMIESALVGSDSMEDLTSAGLTGLVTDLGKTRRGMIARDLIISEFTSGHSRKGSTTGAFTSAYAELVKGAKEIEARIKKIDDEILSVENQTLPGPDDFVAHVIDGEFQPNIYKVVRVNPDDGTVTVYETVKITEGKKKTKYTVERDFPIEDTKLISGGASKKDELLTLQSEQLINKIERARIDEGEALYIVNTGLEQGIRMDLALDATNLKIFQKKPDKTKGQKNIPSGKYEAEYITLKNEAEIAKLDKELEVLYKEINGVRDEYGASNDASLYVRTSEAIESIRKEVGLGPIEFYHGKRGNELPLGPVPYYAEVRSSVRIGGSAKAKTKGLRYYVKSLGPDELAKAVDTNLEILKRLRKKTATLTVTPRESLVYADNALRILAEVISSKYSGVKYLDEVAAGQTAIPKAVKQLKLSTIHISAKEGSPFPYLKVKDEFILGADGKARRLSPDEFLAIFIRDWSGTGGDIIEGLTELVRSFPRVHRSHIDDAIDNYFTHLARSVDERGGRFSSLRKMIDDIESVGDNYNIDYLKKKMSEIEKPVKRNLLLEHLGDFNLSFAQNAAVKALKSHAVIKKELRVIAGKIQSKTNAREKALKSVGDKRDAYKAMLDKRESLAEELKLLYEQASEEIYWLSPDLLSHPSLAPTSPTGLYKEIKRVQKELSAISVPLREHFVSLSFADALKTASDARLHRLTLEKSLDAGFENLPYKLRTELQKKYNETTSLYKKIFEDREKLAIAVGASERLAEAVHTVRNSMASMKSRLDSDYIETGSPGSYEIPVTAQNRILVGSTSGTSLAAKKAGKIEYIPASYKRRLVSEYGADKVNAALLKRGVLIEGLSESPIIRTGADRPTSTLMELGMENPSASKVRFDSVARNQLELMEDDLYRTAEIYERYNHPELYAEAYAHIAHASAPWASAALVGRQGFFGASVDSLRQLMLVTTQAFDPMLARVGTKTRKEVTEVYRKMFNYQQSVHGQLNVIADGPGGVSRVYDWLTTQTPISIETGRLQKKVKSSGTSDVSPFNLVGSETPVELWIRRVLGDRRSSRIEDTIGAEDTLRFDELLKKHEGTVKINEKGEPELIPKEALTEDELAEWIAIDKKMTELYDSEANSELVAMRKFKGAARKIYRTQLKIEKAKTTAAIETIRRTLATDAVARMWVPSGQRASDLGGILSMSTKRLVQEISERAASEGRRVDKNDLMYLSDRLKAVTYSLTGATDVDSRAIGFLFNGIIHGALEEKLIRNVSRVIGPSIPDSIPSDMNKILNGFQESATVDFKAALSGFSQWGTAMGYMDPRQGGNLVTEFKTIEQKLTGMGASINEMIRVSRSDDLNKINTMPTSLLDNFDNAAGVVTKTLEQVWTNPDVGAGSIAFFTRKMVNLLRVWKMAAVIGLLAPRGQHFLNMGAGDLSQVHQHRGLLAATTAMAGNLPMYLPGLGKRVQEELSDMLLRAKDTRASESWNPVMSQLDAATNPWLAEVFRGSERMFSTKDGLRSGRELLEELHEVGASTHIVSKEMLETEDFVRNDMKKFFRLQNLLPGQTENWLYKNWAKNWGNWIGDIQTRQRSNAYLHARSKLQMGVDDAKKFMDDQFYDWSTGVARWEARTIGRVSAFYTFWRLSFGQLIRAIAEPIVDRPTSVLMNGLRGKTQLARIVQQKRVLFDGIPAWLSDREGEDKEEIAIWEAHQNSGSDKPGWAGDRPTFSNGTLLTPEERKEHYENTGRHATHSVVLQPLATAVDTSNIAAIFTGGLLGLIATLSGSKDISANPKNGEKIFSTITDQFFPIYDDAFKAARGSNMIGERTLIPVSSEQATYLRMADAGNFGTGLLSGPIWYGDSEIIKKDGRYYRYGDSIAGKGNSSLYFAAKHIYPVLGTDVPRLFRDLYLDNPDIRRGDFLYGMMTALRNNIGFKSRYFDEHQERDYNIKKMKKDSNYRKRMANEKVGIKDGVLQPEKEQE